MKCILLWVKTKWLVELSSLEALRKPLKERLVPRTIRWVRNSLKNIVSTILMPRDRLKYSRQ